jgi:uncharacterized membrane protein YcjF (UPF0283 family)
MLGQKSAGFVRAMKGLPSSIGRAGLKSLSRLGKAGKIVKPTPDARGRFRSITGPAVGRVVIGGTDRTAAAPARFVAQHTPSHMRVPRAAITFGALSILALATGLLDWMYEAFRAPSISGLVLSPIFMIALLSATLWLWRELRSWRSLAIVEQLQLDLSCPCDTAAEEDRFRAAFARLAAIAREPQFVRFVNSADLTADVAGLRDGLDRIGLHAMDQNAVAAIHGGTRDVFFLSLVSTNALAEVLLFSLRAVGLMRRVASAYGCRPGGFGLLRLARHIFADIALLPVGMLVALEAGREAGSAIRHVAHGAQAAASVAHPLAGVAVGAIGHAVGAVAEGVTPRVAEATLAAGRMAHLGLLAAAIVRPVAFSEPRYREMRNGVYRQILGLRRDALSNRKRGSGALSDEPGAA